jgi:hypothetical protein
VVEQGAYIVLRDPDCIRADLSTKSNLYHVVATADAADVSTTAFLDFIMSFTSPCPRLTRQQVVQEAIANPLAVTGNSGKKDDGVDQKSKPQRRVMRQSGGVDRRRVLCRKEKYRRWRSCQPSHISSPRSRLRMGIHKTLKATGPLSSSTILEPLIRVTVAALTK